MPTHTRKQVDDWDKADLSHDFIFSKVMLDPRILKPFLEDCVAKPIPGLKVGRQQELNATLDAKAVRLDVSAMSALGAHFNLEMQVRNYGDVPPRCRYYGSSVDQELLASGQDYGSLNDSYVIFICMFDPIGDGKAMHTFRMYDTEADQALNDGFYVILLYPFGDTSKLPANVGGIMDMLAQRKPRLNDITDLVKERIAYVKQSPELRREFQMLNMIQRDSFVEGLTEGRVEGRVETMELFAIVKKLLTGNLSNKEIIAKVKEKADVESAEVMKAIELLRS